MLYSGKTLTLAASLFTASLAYPRMNDGSLDVSLEKRFDGFPDNLNDRIPPYQAPGPTDSRGPCPGLNTLANHGLIPRNGKKINSNDIKAGFQRGFGINENGFDTALHNFEVVCEYVKGTTCGTAANDGTFILTNLTLLGEPHTFEHDHSYSRLDYKQNFAHGDFGDNIYFNSTEFQVGLNVVGYKPTNPPVKAFADYSDFNEIRLKRESRQNKRDFPGWFQQNIPPTLFETGFIFGVTFDRDSAGNMLGDTPSVRLDWWNFWFSEESFPTHLGWVPASTSFFDINFITSVSKSVLNAPITSTPDSLPQGATDTTAAPAGNLPEADPEPTRPLFAGTAYIAPTNPADIMAETNNKRDAMALANPAAQSQPTPIFPSSVLSEVASIITAAPDFVAQASEIVGPAPSKYNFYAQKLDVQSVKNQVAQAISYEEAIVSKITSLAGQ